MIVKTYYMLALCIKFVYLKNKYFICNIIIPYSKLTLFFLFGGIQWSPILWFESDHDSGMYNETGVYLSTDKGAARLNSPIHFLIYDSV